MIQIEGLFEAHLTVRDIERSVAFYRDVVGLELGIAQPERPAAFFWVGGRGRSMMSMFTSGSWPIKSMEHHVPRELRFAGLTPMGGRREPIDEPVVFGGMPAASVFFD